MSVTSTGLVLSASRRTDIPAFYMGEFMDRIAEGGVVNENPFNGKQSIIPATPDRVRVIVFWSKNYGVFLDRHDGERLRDMGYHLYFNFTVNSESSVLEPEVPPLDRRLRQLEALVDRFGAKTVQWRFDPVCRYVDEKGGFHDNLGDFDTIAQTAGHLKIKRCVTSFMDMYTKVKNRLKRVRPEWRWVDPEPEDKVAVLSMFENKLSRFGIDLYVCCEKETLSRLPVGTGIRPSACIPGDLLARMFDVDISLRKDSGQRVKQGCGCGVSVDIGSYRRHPCRHNCLYCYASPLKS